MGKERLARYSLAGPENQAAVDAGLAGGDWFRSDVPRKRMKELMRRSDYPAIRDTAIWLGLLLLFAGLGIAFYATWRFSSSIEKYSFTSSASQRPRLASSRMVWAA